MKLFSSLALVAALFLSSSVAADSLKQCGSERQKEKNFEVYDADIVSGSIDPMNEMCVDINGEFRSAFNDGSMVKFSVSIGNISRDWESPAYSSMRVQGTTPFTKGEHRFQVCSYLNDAFKDTPSGKQISVKIEFLNKDSDGDLVNFFCVSGPVSVKRSS